MVRITPKKLIITAISLVALLIIIYLAVWVRMRTLNSPTVLDYDPFWFFRYAKNMVENGLAMPNWDLLSYYPPGRPTEPFYGWPLTMAIFFNVLSFFLGGITFTTAAILSPLIMVALTPIPAFFLGRILTGNNVSGLAIAIFATLTPTFIGVSMAGYSDSDAAVVFYSFLSILSVILALKKRSILYYVFAILVNLLFIFNWGGGWITLILFLAFFPAIFLFRLLEDIINSRRLTLNLQAALKEVKTFLFPLLIILIATNLISYFLWGSSLVHSFLGGLAFTGFFGQPLIVNISVAELQPINIFSNEGFSAVTQRVGLLPIFLTFFGLPLLVLYKLYRKEKIGFEEIFLFLWALVMFYLITRGVRFSLLFSVASATSAGYVIGNLFNYLKGKNLLIFSTVFGVIAFLSLLFVSDAIQIGLTSGGMLISQNWYDMLDWLKQNADENSLIVTWWDPGHIIAGYTGLKVHADGAHCGPDACIPYNHNIRIQDMGRVFSISDEEEAIEILSKYKELTPQQCQEARNAFGDRIPEEACDPISEMYVIASADLIAKYYWMSYFGTGTGRNFFQLPFSNIDQAQGIINYADGSVSLVREEDQWIPIYQNRYVIKELVYFEGGELKQRSFENVTNTIDALLWVDPTFGMAILMEPPVRDGIFTKLFFWNGQGLEHFELIELNNPEIRLYKVVF